MIRIGVSGVVLVLIFNLLRYFKQFSSLGLLDDWKIKGCDCCFKSFLFATMSWCWCFPNAMQYCLAIYYFPRNIGSFTIVVGLESRCVLLFVV